ncbi:hypothetical protein BCR42DRAFT_412707 [Absidia repens]|uniref:Uncharacterized protein n=1 Tax=Absidia repens TaxID=90262 RepID=A0A1X2IK00_9FUNG|nr:hypothetical protein BCR42DRAFT_412707 [Absidia repens]
MVQRKKRCSIKPSLVREGIYSLADTKEGRRYGPIPEIYLLFFNFFFFFFFFLGNSHRGFYRPGI